MGKCCIFIQIIIKYCIIDILVEKNNDFKINDIFFISGFYYIFLFINLLKDGNNY